MSTIIDLLKWTEKKPLKKTIIIIITVLVIYLLVLIIQLAASDIYYLIKMGLKNIFM